MKKISAALILLLVSASVFAWTIGPMNYQGRLLDNSGIPVTGSYNFKVRIYDAASGGTLKFSEQHNSVAVDDGVYSFLVSTGTNSTGAWDIALWNTPQLFLEIEVGGETLSPRHLMAAAPYAFQANLALTTNNALALGGKSSGQVLQDICNAGKGKWLELSNQCLGIGASFPGPATVNLNTLTASTDLSNLDLTNADISGIHFGAVDFTGTVFKGTTINAAGLEGANFTDAEVDGANFTGATQSSSAMNLTGATFKNINMNKWSLNGATLSGFSAALLSACPSTLAANWVCVEQRTGSGEYVLLGPGVNLSTSSAAKVAVFGADTLDLDRTVLNGKNLTNANLQGIAFQQDLIGTNLTGANLSYTHLHRIAIDGANLTNAIFEDALIEWLDGPVGTIINGTSFQRTRLYYAFFGDALVSNSDFSYTTFEYGEFGNITDMNFSKVLFIGVKFQGDLLGSIVFQDGRLASNNDSIYFRGNLSANVSFINIKGDSFIFENPVPATTVFSGGEFYALYGNFSGVTLSNLTLREKFTHTGPTNQAGPTFNNITLNNINFNYANSNSSLANTIFTGACTLLNNSLTDFSGYTGYFTGTDFGNCAISGANWMSVAACPDGQPASAGSNSNSCEDGQML